MDTFEAGTTIENYGDRVVENQEDFGDEATEDGQVTRTTIQWVTAALERSVDPELWESGEGNSSEIGHYMLTFRLEHGEAHINLSLLESFGGREFGRSTLDVREFCRRSGIDAMSFSIKCFLPYHYGIIVGGKEWIDTVTKEFTYSLAMEWRKEAQSMKERVMSHYGVVAMGPNARITKPDIKLSQLRRVLDGRSPEELDHGVAMPRRIHPSDTLAVESLVESMPENEEGYRVREDAWKILLFYSVCVASFVFYTLSVKGNFYDEDNTWKRVTEPLAILATVDFAIFGIWKLIAGEERVLKRALFGRYHTLDFERVVGAPIIVSSGELSVPDKALLLAPSGKLGESNTCFLIPHVRRGRMYLRNMMDTREEHLYFSVASSQTLVMGEDGELGLTRERRDILFRSTVDGGVVAYHVVGTPEHSYLRDLNEGEMFILSRDRVRRNIGGQTVTACPLYGKEGLHGAVPT